MVITKKTITIAIATLLLIVVSIGVVSTISFSNSRKAQAVKLAEKHTRYFLENATDLETTVKNEEDIYIYQAFSVGSGAFMYDLATLYPCQHDFGDEENGWNYNDARLLCSAKRNYRCLSFGQQSRGNEY